MYRFTDTHLLRPWTSLDTQPIYLILGEDSPFPSLVTKILLYIKHPNGLNLFIGLRSSFMRLAFKVVNYMWEIPVRQYK